MKTFIQIGTCTGSDDFQKMCESQSEKCRIILIEPNSRLNSIINHNYQTISQFHQVYLINKAIVDDLSTNEIKLHYKDGLDELSSLIDRRTYMFHEYMIVPSTTLDNILDEFEILKVDELHIDAEGLDYTILLSLNLDKYDFRLITCEVWPYDDDDKSNKFRTGPNLLLEVMEKFSEYSVTNTIISSMPSLKFEKNLS